MDTLIIIVSWLLFCVLAAIGIRIVTVAIANKNGYTSETMPMKFHAIAFGVYFTLIYPALWVLNQIF